MFYPYVTISAAQACESDDLRYAIEIAKNLGICEAAKKSETKATFDGAFELGLSFSVGSWESLTSMINNHFSHETVTQAGCSGMR